MTNYPQQPQFSGARNPQPGGFNEANNPQGMNGGPSGNVSPMDDPGMRLILSMSPQDGSLRPLPSDLRIEESQDGTLNVTYPDGSVRQLIPGAEGEGRMITTLADGTRIQSDLTFGEGQVSVSSISSTGEKTLLSLNENGANMQRVTPDGQVFSFIPDSAPELIESFREAEAFAQEQDFQRQEDFQTNQQYGEWNNYGKPVDWQPEQNWQPPQGDFMQPPMQPQNFGPQFGGPEFGGPQPMPFAPMQPQHFGGNDFGRPDYAGNNWIDNGNGSWIAPIQPDAFPQPLSFQPPQQYGEWNNYGKPVDWQPEQNWQPPQGNYMPSQNYGMPSAHQPSIAAAAWAPQSALFHQPEQNWQPPQGDFMPPQNFGPQFGGPEFGGPQPMPFAPVQPQNFGGNDFGRPDYAGNNWVDNGNGSWIAPVQPNAFQFPAIETQVPAPYSMGQSNINVVPGVESTNWQPPQGNYMQPQNFGPQFGGPQGIIDTNGYPQPMPFAPVQPQNFGPQFGGPQGIIDTNDFPQPMPFVAAQPHDSLPQFGGPQFGGAQGIIDTNGYPQAVPMIANDASVPSGGYVDVMAYSRQAPMTDASGFMKSPQTDSSGFPIAPDSPMPSFDGASPVVEIVTSFDDVAQDPSNDLEQAPQQ